jgi:hypothetical protein
VLCAGSTESARRSLAFNGAADATPAAGVAAATLGTAEPSVTFGSEVRNGVSSAAADGLGVSYEAAASTAGVTTDAARFWDSAEDVSGSHDRSGAQYRPAGVLSSGQTWSGSCS